MIKPQPNWVIEVRKEIRRLQAKIKRLDAKAERDEMTGYDYEDKDNWEGWLAGLRWCLKMRDGKATRQDAWGKPDTFNPCSLCQTETEPCQYRKDLEPGKDCIRRIDV